MPSLKSIRNRIGSVKNTRKITKAMKLVAAARLRRAQEAIWAARPYAKGLADVIADVAARAGVEAHPLLERRPLERVELVVVGGDRGLSGAFNSNINRATERWLIDHQPGQPNGHKETSLTVVGRKSREYLTRRKYKPARQYPAASSPQALERSREISHGVIERFLNRETDAVYLVYNEFKSAIAQVARVEQVLPVVPSRRAVGVGGDYTYEPSRTVVLDQIVPLYVQIEIYRALLESIASQFGAQMSAMDSATKNATEMIARLTLQYNRARQAAITKELLEIIGGAEALKG